MKERCNMTGSLQLKNNMYYVVMNYKDKNNKQKQKWVSTKLKYEQCTPKQAKKKLAEIISEFDDNMDSNSKSISFNSYLETVLENKKGFISDVTYYGQKQTNKKIIIPYFEGMKLADITTTDVQNFVNQISKTYSTSSVSTYKTLVSIALNQAVQDKLIATNVAKYAKVRNKQDQTEAVFYSINEIKKLVETAKGNKLYIPIILAGYLGLRRSEILGLKWECIDFEKGSISIENKMTAIYDGKHHVTIESNVMKTASSKRKLPLSDGLKEILCEHRQWIIQNNRKYKDRYTNEYNDYVCVNKYGEIIKPSNLTNSFIYLLKKSGLRKLKFHDLRHSCGSMLLDMGYSIKHIQSWLGHSNFNTTANIYLHISNDAKVDMSNALDDALNIIY